MKTVQDVAKVFRKKAAQAIYPGVPYKTGSSRAFKTGNLLTKFISDPRNSFDNIPKQVGDSSYIFELQIAPAGAYYGRWVHNGTRKMNARPFGQIASGETEVINIFQEFTEGVAEDFIEKKMEPFRRNLLKSGFKMV
jgi:hypothetical protein